MDKDIEHAEKALACIDKMKEGLSAKASPPQRSTRKKPSADRNAVSGEETDGGATTRPSEEKPM